MGISFVVMVRFHHLLAIVVERYFHDYDFIERSFSIELALFNLVACQL